MPVSKRASYHTSAILMEYVDEFVECHTWRGFRNLKGIVPALTGLRRICVSSQRDLSGTEEGYLAAAELSEHSRTAP